MPLHPSPEGRGFSARLGKVVLEIIEIYKEFKLILERGIGFAPMTSYLVGKHSTTALPIAFMAVLIGFEPITFSLTGS